MSSLMFQGLVSLNSVIRAVFPGAYVRHILLLSDKFGPEDQSENEQTD